LDPHHVLKNSFQTAEDRELVDLLRDLLQRRTRRFTDIKSAVRVASAVGGVKSVTNDMQVK